ncbi:recombinase family protein [Microbacterium hydrocarbonoxydans]|uniref:Site-specific DNA recombinase n=1 Tax=Microbacterium hydrocarbonoxydans TaxID=273678 RepID=A0A1H4MF45_9MICO|nr:recombinase family protein [Microbacterium hydrocarbonoxydans]SEB81324.1 Site-specific DNA recombinase [Microbacterium hydrocarbonoxydans]
MKVAIYTRISQDREGTEVGVLNQEVTCREIAESLGAEAITVYRDNDRGASSRSKKSRPDFQRMLEDAHAGKFSVIVAYSMSRLTRRPREWEDLIQVAEKKGIRYLFKVSPTYDLTTADGRATARTVAAWDAAEAERTGERVQHAVQAKLTQGQDMGGPRPFGFTVDRQSIVEEEADALRWAYAQILDGRSLVSIAREFTERGILRDRAKENSWRPQTIRNMLLRPRNVGRLQVKGVLYAENLPAIIDVETHEAVKAILENPSRKPTRGREPVKQSLTGLVACGVCGNYVRLASSRGQSYLKCAADGRPISTAKLRHPTMLLASAEIEVQETVKVTLMTYAALDKDFSTSSDTKDLQLRIAELRRRRDLTQDLLIEPGMNVPKLKADIAGLGLEIDSLQQSFDQAVASNVGGVALDAAVDFIHQVGQEGVGSAWSAFWDSVDVAQRRSLISAVMPNARLMLSNGKRRRIIADVPDAVKGAEPVALLAGLAEAADSSVTGDGAYQGASDLNG